MQQPFPDLHNFWFTGLDQRVAGPEDFDSHNYPWFHWREPYTKRLAREFVSPADIPDPQRYNHMSDINRGSTIANTVPLAEDPLQFTMDAYENQRRWYEERGLAGSMDVQKYSEKDVESKKDNDN